MICTSSSATGAPAWAFSSYQEDWGLTCEASIQIGFDRIGFFGAPGNSTVAFLTEQTLPETTSSQWRANGRVWQLEGATSDYSGYQEYYDIPDELLHEIAAASLLTIEVEGSGSMDVPLQGSGSAIDKFLSCWRP
jgi:hypothetical protein